MNKTLRKVIKLGSSKAITIPEPYLASVDYVWLEKDDGSIKITPAKVE